MLLLSTFEFDVQATEFKFHSLKSLTKGLMIMPNALLRPHAERQREVCVRLLPIMIRTNGVHPQNDFIMIIILKQMQLWLFTNFFTNSAVHKHHCNIYCYSASQKSPYSTTKMVHYCEQESLLLSVQSICIFTLYLKVNVKVACTAALRGRLYSFP
jgi:hypothetical protein